MTSKHELRSEMLWCQMLPVRKRRLKSKSRSIWPLVQQWAGQCLRRLHASELWRCWRRNNSNDEACGNSAARLGGMKLCGCGVRKFRLDLGMRLGCAGRILRYTGLGGNFNMTNNNEKMMKALSEMANEIKLTGA